MDEGIEQLKQKLRDGLLIAGQWNSVLTPEGVDVIVNNIILTISDNSECVHVKDAAHKGLWCYCGAVEIGHSDDQDCVVI